MNDYPPYMHMRISTSVALHTVAHVPFPHSEKHTMILVAPHWPPWFSGSLEHCQPSETRCPRRRALYGTVTHNMPANCLAPELELLLSRGLTSTVVKTILSARDLSSSSLYSLTWHAWTCMKMTYIHLHFTAEC